MKLYVPILVLVVSNVFYHIFSKSVPETVSPYASLVVTYLVGAAFSALCYFFTKRGGGFLSEFRQMNWATWALGLAVVGLEVGSIEMYRFGWNISLGQLVSNSAVAVCLVFVGLLFYRETLTVSQITGIAVILLGLYIVNKK